MGLCPLPLYLVGCGRDSGGPLFAQAIEDALGHTGVELLEIPLSPSQVWEMVQEIKLYRK